MKHNAYSDMRILIIPPSIGYDKFRYLEKYFKTAYFVPALAVMLFSQVSLPYDTVVTGSAPSCGIYKSFGLNSTNIFHYGIDLNLFSNKFDDRDKQKLRNKFGLPREKRAILFTGRGAQDKNIHGLIEAFKKLNVKLPNTCLVITTIFDDERCMERCKKLAKSLEQKREYHAFIFKDF